MTPKLHVEKLAILSSDIETNELQIRKYIAKEWRTLTKGLQENAIILFIAGVHGSEDGRLSKPAESVERLQEQFSKFLELNHKKVFDDKGRRLIRFEFLDVKKFYLDANICAIDEEALEMEIMKINPHVVVLAICFSKTLQLKFKLESSGLFPRLRMQRDLILISKGRILTLDQTQSDLLMQLAKDENNHKTVVISGPEGSGKSLLAVEATKMKIYSLLKKHSSSDQVKIRVVLCAAYQGDNRVPVLFRFLKEELEGFGNHCLIDLKPLADLSFTNVMDLQSKIQKELLTGSQVYTREDDILFTQLLPKVDDETESIAESATKPDPIVPNQEVADPNFQDQQTVNKSKGRDPGVTMVPKLTSETIVLLDEVSPGFDLHQWKQFKSDWNVEYVVALRHTFSQSSFPKEPPLEKVSAWDNTLICVLDKRLRCSHEITALVFYLMIHSKNNATLKSFEHSLDSFEGDVVPMWIDVESVEDFIYFAKETYHSVDCKTVMVIYDPIDDQFELQPLLKYCKDKDWQCHPYSSIIGSEASTVFLYNLKEFHFESFTRATNELIIITIKSSVESQVSMFRSLFSRFGLGRLGRYQKSKNKNE